MLRKNSFIYVFLVGLVFVSCEDALEEIPDNRTQIDNAEKVAELLTLAYPQGGYASFLEPRTDNADDKGPSAREFRENTEMYFWRDVDDIDSDFPNNYWNECYAAIAQANHALEAIKNLGQSSELNALKGEALLARAYAHFMLVNIWSKPYNPATAGTDLGIPYVTEPEDVVLKEYSRGTVKDVYDNIQADIENGLPLVDNIYDVPKFHFTKEAANAFASRFYLYIGNWAKVIEHSNQVLGNNPVVNLRDWAGQYRTFTYSETSNFYASASETANLLITSGNSVYARKFASARYQLSNGLNDFLFFSNNATGKGWAYRVFGNSLFLNIPKFDEYFRVTNQAANIGFAFTNYVLLTTDEVLLNRAEAYAMLGDLDLAINDINSFLSVKTNNYDPATDIVTTDNFNAFYNIPSGIYTPFYSIPDQSLAFVHGITEMRRREFQNEGMRWFDLKRFNLPVLHQDELGNEDILLPGDNRRELQIPVDAIAFGLEANPR